MMQKSDSTKSATKAYRKVRSSTTLNRKYVRRPVLSGDVTVAIKQSSKLRHFANTAPKMTISKHETITPPVSHPLQEHANQKLQARKKLLTATREQGLSAKEIKEQAIQKAIASASSVNFEQERTKFKGKLHFGFGRIVLALSCAALATFAIVYFVNLNMPDLSLRVAAMQTGINASYPGYVPRDYSASRVSSEDGRVVLDFLGKNREIGFTIIEEISSWDSSALLANYVKTEFGENYSVIREQGLTIYISGSKASWVNGGVLYKINAQDGVLSNKQIRSIAVSL